MEGSGAPVKVVALINQKGGVGKTTLALHLATAFQARGHDTVLLDLDPQASAAEWSDARADALPPVRSIQPTRLERTLGEAREIGTALVLLDTAPHTEATALAAARASDLILVPCQPRIMDLRAMRRTADLVRMVGTPAWVVLNGVPHRGTVAGEAEETIAQDIGLPVAPPRLGYRVAFDRALISGQTAQEFEPDGKAAVEVRDLYLWTCRQAGLEPGGEEDHG